MECAVMAFNALCAEHGPQGKAYSMAAEPDAPPWSWDDPMVLCPGATPRRTVETFVSMFGDEGLKMDTSGRCQSAAEKLHKRAAHVKKVIDAGYDELQLHSKLSWHAWNCATSCLQRGTVKHAHTGPCVACQIYCPEEYEALKPQKAAAGRPPKQKRASRTLKKADPPSACRSVCIIIIISCNSAVRKPFTHIFWFVPHLRRSRRLQVSADRDARRHRRAHGSRYCFVLAPSPNQTP